MTSYVFLADGFEEIEAITPIDVLRRAGMDVKSVSITDSRKVTGAHGVPVEADETFKQVDFADADWLIFPGGLPGATNLHDFAALMDLLKIHAAKGRHVAAICASPAMVLAPEGVLDGRRATGYPGTEEAARKYGAQMEDRRYVVDGNVITSNGPSSSLLFALAIVAETLGKDVAAKVASGMLLYPGDAPYYF